jgi:hypothetical protein
LLVGKNGRIKRRRLTKEGVASNANALVNFMTAVEAENKQYCG